MPFISSLISLPRSSNTVLNKSGKNWHLCLVPDLGGKTLSFLSLSMKFGVGLSYMACIILRYVTSLPTLLWVFIISECWILSSAFFWLYWADHIIFVFHFVDMVCHIDWPEDAEPFLHSWNKSHLIIMYDPVAVLLISTS